MPINDGIYFDAKSVELDVAFIESLTLTKSTLSGKPEPFILLPCHKKLVVNALGWKKADGTRQYRNVYFSTGRKNAKTQICAALALDQLVLSDEYSPEVVLAAKTRDQASLVYEAAVQMVYAHPELSKILKTTPYSRTILNPLNGGKLQAIASEGKAAHGRNVSCCIIDELHTWTESEQELWDALQSGSNARRSPLWIVITTAGLDTYSLCARQYDYACKVRDHVIEDPSFLSLIYELPKDADYTNEKLWHLANPTLGKIVRIEGLREDLAKALNVPSEITAFRRLAMNQWVNSVSQWIGLDKWDACSWAA